MTKSPHLRRADARFLLPDHPRTAAVLGGLDGWARGLTEAGVDVRGSSDRHLDPPDLVVAPSTLVSEAIATRAATVLVEGAAAHRELLASGYAPQRFLPLGNTANAEILLPLDQRRPARYGIERWTVSTRRWKQVRNRIVGAAVALGVLPTTRPLLTLGAQRVGPPFLVGAARELGVPPDVGWLLVPGEQMLASRGVFHLFPPGADVPAWVLKFARVPGDTEGFAGDERGLRLVHSAGAGASAHAPRLIGRFEAAGLPASLETAAVGIRLISLLRSPRSRRTKLRTIERVADWLLGLARETAAPPAQLEPERHRLTSKVLPGWSAAGVPRDLAAALPPLRAVLAHGDLAPWNVIVDRDRFTVIDWEDAVRYGFPLWDLVYFLADSFAQLEGTADPPVRDSYFAELFHGEAVLSKALFVWIRSAVDVSGVPPNAVGPLLTLLWLDQTRWGDESRARIWLGDEGLGIAWDRWRT